MSPPYIFTLALTFGGAAVAFVRPYYGFLAYVAIAILRPSSLWPWSVPVDSYNLYIGVGLLLAWAMHGFGSWRFSGAHVAMIGLFGYWGWFVLSAIFAPYPSIAFRFVDIHSKILIPIVVGMTLIDSVAQLKQLVWVLVLCLGFMAFEANLDHLQGGRRLLFYGIAGMGDNNSTSIAMVTGAALAFFLGISERSWKRWFCFLLAGLMAHSPMFGDSRGGMLALVVTGVVSFILLPKRPMYLIIMALAVAVAVRMAGDNVIARFATTFAEEEERDASAQSRLDLWKQCTDAAVRNPLFGVGPDHWPIVAGTQYGWGGRKEAHSIWFNALAEFGFPGFFFLLLFYLSTYCRLWIALIWSKFNDEKLAELARMAIASLSAFFVAASFVSLDVLEPPYYVVLIGMVVLRLNYQCSRSDPKIEKPRLRSREMSRVVGREEVLVR